MAEKSFGVIDIELLGESSSTPTIVSDGNLEIEAVVVGMTTDLDVGRNLNVASKVGIGTTVSTANKLHVVGNSYIDGNITVQGDINFNGSINQNNLLFERTAETIHPILSSNKLGIGTENSNDSNLYVQQSVDDANSSANMAVFKTASSDIDAFSVGKAMFLWEEKPQWKGTGSYSGNSFTRQGNFVIINANRPCNAKTLGTSDNLVFQYIRDYYYKFDLDGDGVVSPTDAYLFLRWLVNTGTSTFFEDLHISPKATRKTKQQVIDYINSELLGAFSRTGSITNGSSVVGIDTTGLGVGLWSSNKSLYISSVGVGTITLRDFNYNTDHVFTSTNSNELFEFSGYADFCATGSIQHTQEGISLIYLFGDQEISDVPSGTLLSDYTWTSYVIPGNNFTNTVASLNYVGSSVKVGGQVGVTSTAPIFYVGASNDTTLNSIESESHIKTNNGFFKNSQSLTTNTTISSTENAAVIGPYTINNGVTLTIESGGTFAVI